MDIKNELECWYRASHRKLIFRESKNPYSIWVSEIMAQQTRIDTMLPYYERWMKQYPDIETLAKAPIEMVLKSWEGLGYYNRARKLHEGAKMINEQYGNQLPDNIDELLQIPGIGPYTAGAIASIAFDKPCPAVDGNVLRVASRLLMLEDDIAKTKTHKKVYEIVKEWMKDSHPSDFTQGLMELGALICMPQVILCEKCPLNQMCLAHLANKEAEYPKKSAKKAPVEINLKTLIVTHQNQLLLCEDWQDGLMKGFLRLPMGDFDTSEMEYFTKKKHVFSHRIWNMEVYISKKRDFPLKEGYHWVDIKEIDQLTIVSAHRKLIESYWRKKIC